MIPALLLSSSAPVYAVAGGGGGGSGGGDGIELIFDLLLWILLDIPFPYNFIVFGVLVAMVWIASKNVQSRSGLNKIPSIAAATAKSFSLPAEFLKRNQGFDASLLVSKANTAFLAIQQAWMQQDMSAVRRWISDGVWQRFNTQFEMMRLLGQKNNVSDIQIKKVFIDAIEQDGDFDIAHIGIHFTVRDDFVSDNFPQLDQRGSLEMLEYWSFIRKAGISEKDLYHSNRCPACGDELPHDMGEMARCPSCKTISTLGDYDWILSEITQADDYANQSGKLEKSGVLMQRIRKALGADADFSVQLIEDKASNAYMQIMAAQATQKAERMRRFTGDALFEKLTQMLSSQAAFVFNRLYLNNVTLIDFYQAEGRDNLVVAIKRTAQRVDITGGKLQRIDQGPYTSDEVLILSRDTGAGKAQGSLYAHACPSCGGPLEDTLDLKCSYCGSLLNSTRNEWIVTQLLSAGEYRALADSQKPAMTTRVAITDLDPLFAVRDYAFNNVLMIIGIDGAITSDEQAFGQALARQMGYDAKKLTGLFELTQNRQLALRLPEDRKSALKVLKLMEKAAQSDHVITPDEQALLDEVQTRIDRMAA